MFGWLTPRSSLSWRSRHEARTVAEQRRADPDRAAQETIVSPEVALLVRAVMLSALILGFEAWGHRRAARAKRHAESLTGPSTKYRGLASGSERPADGVLHERKNMRTLR